ncbi:MAG TPA: PAS domain S-box protein [Mucilaginibacter sp.]|jgi:PAS domain S-box-containing protein|nr:PAS domain S-box protein [Mucilaginibacter sp.]
MPNSSKTGDINKNKNEGISFGQVVSDLRFRKLVENSYDGIILLEQNLDIIYRSNSAQRIVGWKPEDRGKSGLLYCVYPGDRECVETDLDKVLSEPGTSITSIFKVKHTDGHYIWVECIFTNRLEDPDINAIVCNFRDITRNKEIELLLQKKAQQIEDILESIGDAFFAVDKNWIVTYWNHMAEKILHRPKNEILNRNLWEVYADSLESESYKRYHQAIETNEVVRFEDYYPPLNKWYEISAFPSNNGLSVYFKDITERLSYVKAIEEQNENLKEISWLQSHVIRAPLARIMGLIHLIKDANEDPAEKQNALNYLLSSADELDEVIRTITDKTDLHRKRPTSEA